MTILAQRTQFIDSDDEDVAMEHQDAAGPCAQPLPPPQPPRPPTTPAQFTLVSTISTDFDKNDQCYVLHLAHAAATGSLAAALSNRHIKLFALKDSGIQFVGDLCGHTGPITSAHCPLIDEPSLLQTSSTDGTVREWDLRSGQAVRVFSAGTQEIACCATNGTFVAAGSRDNVLFWDRGSGRAATGFKDTHFQDVTQVEFHPHSRSAFVSASEDGLIAVFDTAAGLDEDEGFKAAINIDTAVASIGFYGPHGGDSLWCCSGTETVHLWEWAAACDDAREGGNGPLGQSLDPRQKMVLGERPADYLVRCEYNAQSDELVVVAGSNDGSCGLFAVERPSSGATDGALQFGNGPVGVMHGGHADIVRSVQWVGGAGPLWVSGGEDARLCVWSSAPGAAPLPRPTASSGGGGSRSSGEGASRSRGGGQQQQQQQQQSGSSHMKRVAPY